MQDENLPIGCADMTQAMSNNTLLIARGEL